MPIRTLDGPPLPGEILAHAARAVVLAGLLAGQHVCHDENRSVVSEAEPRSAI